MPSFDAAQRAATSVTSAPVQDAINARVYHADGVQREYAGETRLTRVETVALLKYHDAFADRAVLDVGVGLGRTSLYLAPLARRYEAIDYSPVMVQALRERMPALSVRLADMRDLAPFEDGSFDFVFAPNNVIDAVGEADRHRTLAEMRRVLRSGGVFVFSSHNLHRADALAGPRPGRSRNPVTQTLLLARWLRQLRNHHRVAPARAMLGDHALLNDRGHDYACLHYYVSQAYERRELEAAGFQVLDVFDDDGQPVGPEERAPRSASLTYVARRAAEAAMR